MEINPSLRNNFTPLRLALALAVVLGHFKVLASLGQTTLFPFNVADAAVESFFIVSGYLVTKSYDSRPELYGYAIRRLFRLYPLLIVVILLQAAMMLILLPSPHTQYIASTARYLTANLFLAPFLQTDIGGLFHVLPVQAVNPSLWTLKIELAFYILVPLLWPWLKRRGIILFVVLYIGSAAYREVLAHYGMNELSKQIPGQLQFFLTGMAILRYQPRLARIPSWAGALAGIAALAAWLVFRPVLPYYCHPILMGAFTYGMTFCTTPLHMRHDLSYGVYLLHAPLLQTLLLLGLFHDNPAVLAAVLTAVICLALISEHVIEEPFIALGQKIAKRPPPWRKQAVEILSDE